MSDIKIEKWCQHFCVENANPKDDFDNSFGFAHVWISSGYMDHVYPWQYSRSESLEDGAPDLEKFRFVLPAKLDYVTQLAICADKLREQSFLRKSTKIAWGYNPANPRGIQISDWTDEIACKESDFEGLSDKDLRSKLEVNRERLFEHFIAAINRLVDDEGPFTEDWYLLNIVAMYLSEPEPSQKTLFSVGALYAEYIAVTMHAEKHRMNEERQAKAAERGGMGKKEIKKQNISELFKAAEIEAKFGVYDLSDEKEFRKAAVRRVQQKYESENKKFPTSAKTHAEYFEEITKDPKMKSKYYNFFENA